MATEHRQQLNVRISLHPHRLLGLRAERVRNATQLYGPRGAGRDAAAPARDAFVARLVQDMRDLMAEFEQSFETGCR
jgi:hypothetical protein